MKHASTGSREQIRKHFLKIPREQQTECVSELCDQVGWLRGSAPCGCVIDHSTIACTHAERQLDAKQRRRAPDDDAVGRQAADYCAQAGAQP